MPRYAPPGVSSDAHLAKEMERLLVQSDDDTRAQAYMFHVDVTTSLHKGQVVVAKGTGRRGTLADAPPPCDLLQPLNRHRLRVRWNDADADATAVATDLTPACTRTERQLSIKLRTLAKNTPPFRATLDGTLVTVEAQAYDALHELRVAMLTMLGEAEANRVGPIEAPVADAAHQARFYQTHRPAANDPEAQALEDPGRVRLHDARSRLRATVTNRKAYALRHDPWWNQYGDENVALTQRRRRRVNKTVKSAAPPVAAPCNAQQPLDLVRKDVVVPHWTTGDVVAHYIRAEVVGVEQAPDAVADYRVMRVRCGAHEWTVAIPHVHPVATCQEVRRGSAVFVANNVTTSPAKQRRASAAPVSYTLAHIVRIHQPNDALICGWAGEVAQTVRAPAACTAAAWTAVLEAAFPGHGLTVAFVPVGGGSGKHGGRTPSRRSRRRQGGRRRFSASSASAVTAPPTVRAVVTCAGRARFSITAASTAAPLLGFVAGRTYETTQQADKGVYRLEAPHSIRPEMQQVRTAPLCEVVPLDGGGKRRTLPLEALIAVRPQYSKERDAYKHLSTYQRFPVAFLTPDRPQRGMLLYHEMGAGKSRTAIEMAQRYLEDRYWAHCDAREGVAGMKNSAAWCGQRPSVVLFSPTQEARTHFLKDEVPLWTACWWSREGTRDSDDVWVPKQHVYTQRDPAALYAEMRQHENDVRGYLWGQRQGDMYLSIVLDNTNNLYRVLEHVRTAVANKSIPMSAKREVLQYFGAPWDANTFDINARTDADEYYGRFFRNSFVIIDEMHRLCNAMVNTEASRSQTGIGGFFYRALMEAPHCRLVGLSGTPMQRTAVAFAPLFNLLHGKTKVWTIGFKAGASKQLQEDTYAAVRPLAATIWADHRQAIDTRSDTPQRSALAARIAFSAWPYPEVTRAINTHMESLRRNPLVTIDFPEYELFPFAFQRGRRRGKRYEVDPEPFTEHFVKNNRLKNPVDFAKRIVGFVSYVSPPKVTSDQEPTLDASQVYPQHTVRTCRLAMDPSHHAYLQRIHKRKRDINQRQADAEERSGCNVNWGAVKDRSILDGKEGLIKLFFKGGDQTLRPEAINEAYHQLLAYVHTCCLKQDPRIAPYLRVNDQLEAFAPKMHRILRSLRANCHHKAVVYSEFIDGVGAQVSGVSGVSELSTRALDVGHVGFSGLGLLGYVLETNGYVRFEFEATHVFHELYTMVHTATDVRDARTIARTVGVDRRMPLTAARVLDAASALGLDLHARHPEFVARLETDVDWAQTGVTLRDFGRWIAADTYGPHAKWLSHTRTRYALSRATREGLGLDTKARASYGVGHTSRRRSRAQTRLHSTRSKRASVATSFPPAYIEYGRCLANAPASVSKTTKADVKDFVLRMYNLRTTADLPQLDDSLTPQAQLDLRTLLRHVSTGNAYGGLVQTLLASSKKVTEGVEFKDVRAMHILEPPQDYRQLEQMFGRVIRRGSHPGVRAEDRKVAIRMYVMTMPYALQHVTAETEQQGAAARRFLTKDEQYWEGVIQRKYEISRDFYTLLKHTAVDCRTNLVLNTASAQDKRLTCYEYPYQSLAHEWHDAEAPLYGPADLASNESHTRLGARVVHVPRAVRRA